MKEKDHLNKIIANCVKGDLRSQEELYKKFYGYGMSIALRYSSSRENAVEILNDSFLKVFNKISDFNTDNDFKSWFRRIIINTSIDAYRKERNNIVTITESKNNIFVDNEAICNLRVEEIINIIQKLPSQYKMIFNMYEIEGFTHEEISERLDINISTSRSNLSRAKNKIKELIHMHYEYQRT